MKKSMPSRFQQLTDRAITEMQQSTRQLFETLVTNTDAETVKTACLQTGAKLDRLPDYIIVADLPQWYEPLRSALRSVATGGASHTRTDLARVLTENWHGITASGYDVEAPSVPDFNEIYKKAFVELKIQAAFDTLAEQLRQILETGAIDNLKSLAKLEELIALLRKNRSGSYLQVTGTYAAAVAFKNTMYELAVTVPVLAPLVKATASTMKELDTTVPELSIRVAEEIKDKFLEIGEAWGLLFAVPRLPGPTDPNIIDGEWEVRPDPPAIEDRK